MQGADEFCDVFPKSVQIGRLVLISGRHARGRTFRIYVLPEGEAADYNGSENPPLNQNAVEVYGVTSGQRGWTETYGWLYEGPWVEDFMNIYRDRAAKLEQEQREAQLRQESHQNQKVQHTKELLSSYNKPEYKPNV